MLSFACAAQAQSSLVVNVKGLSGPEGKVLFALFSTEEGFPKEWDKAYKQGNLSFSDGACRIVFDDLPEGTYAMMVAHDENDNGKIDTNFIGMPKEAVGISNYPKMGKPDFQKAKFTMNGQEKKTIEITVEKIFG
ncbi:hypothetical protein PEPS_24960 [Persicobacter psychrovividus]|uniref:DUF2141 domain-containing protein n=1 Tax=Persicobacter psychrovividus TaxID=387638 RepID=A0ABM7VHM5_9BACT|nr:hypothetical protein PEPS_24960 [Persicobacter psychrovividus]